MATRFGRKGTKSERENPTSTAEDEQSAVVEQAAQEGLADDAPEAVSESTEAVEEATGSEIGGSQAIDAQFEGLDSALQEQLAEAIGQTDDPYAMDEFAIDTGVGRTGSARLESLAGELVPDDGGQDALPDGKGMIAADGGSGTTTTSGHPGAYGIHTDKDGEVTGHYAMAPDDGMLFGIDVGAMAMEKEETKKADEIQQNKGPGSGTPAGGGQGSGTGGGQGSGTATSTTTDPDGTITSTYPDGTTIVTNPDGTQAQINPDGSVDIYDKDGNLVRHDPPPPKADPPPADPPPADPPPADPPPADPPTGDPGPDAPYRATLEEKMNDPLFHEYQQAKNAGGGGDGATDPTETDDGVVLEGAITQEQAYEEALGMFGQPADPDSANFGGDRDVPSDHGYWNDQNHGAVTPTDEQDAPDGPQRTKDPFDEVGRDPEAGVPGDDGDSDTSEGGESLLPPDGFRLADPPPDLPDIEAEALGAGAGDQPKRGAIDPADEQDLAGGSQRTQDPVDDTESDTSDGGESLLPNYDILGPVDDPTAEVPDYIDVADVP